MTRFIVLLLTWWMGPFQPVQCDCCLSWCMKGETMADVCTWGEVWRLCARCSNRAEQGE